MEEIKGGGRRRGKESNTFESWSLDGRREGSSGKDRRVINCRKREKEEEEMRKEG